MKKFYLVIVSLVFASLSFSQSRYTVVQLNKKDVPGVIGEIPFVENTVRDEIGRASCRERVHGRV